MSSYYHPLGDEGWSIRVDYDYTPHQPRTAWEPEYPEDISITGIYLGGREISDSIIYQMRDGTDDSKWRAYLDHLRDCIKDDIEEQRAMDAEEQHSVRIAAMHDYDQYDNPKDYPETPEWYHDDPDYGRSAWPRTLALIVMGTFLLAMLFAAGWGLTDIVTRLAGWL